MRDNKKIKNLISKLFILFIFYSFIGWIYEIAYETFLEHWFFMPREFFRGPICPIYGIGGTILFLIFEPIMRNKKINNILKILYVFIVTFVISSILELLMSYVLEAFTGGWPWQNYANYSFNLGGRVSLPTSIKFGIIGLILIFFLYNFINRFLDLLEKKDYLIKLALILIIIFLLDFVFAIIAPTGVKLNVQRTKFINTYNESNLNKLLF